MISQELQIRARRIVTELGYASIREYQRRAGLEADDLVGLQTVASALADDAASHRTALVGWRGSFGLLVRCEGVRLEPYWDGGPDSGVSLPFGWDLGQRGADELEQAYGNLYSSVQLGELATALCRRGPEAEAWLRRRDPARWRVDLVDLAQHLPRLAEPYWKAATRVTPTLSDAPARVQTAFLSVTWNAWVGAPGRAERAPAGADLVRAASEVLQLKGDPRRRSREARLILDELEES